MKLFMRKAEDLKEPNFKSIPRVQRADTATLLGWFDNTIMGLGASFDRWRYHDDPIEEVVQHVEALQMMIDELKNRKPV